MAGAQEHRPAPAGAQSGAGRPAAAAEQKPAGGEAQQPAARPAEHGQAGGREQQPGKTPELAEASKEAAEGHGMKLFRKWLIPGWLVEVLRWSNFVILFGLIAWLLRKPAGRFFEARTRAILQSIETGRRNRDEASARMQDIERRLQGLETEIAQLRAAADAEGRAERDRLARSTADEAAKILAQAEQEIEALGRAAQSELKSYAAALAVQLAEQRIRQRMTPELQAELMREYAGSLPGKSS